MAGLKWVSETSPRWDDDKDRIVGGAPKGALAFNPMRPGEAVPGTWWRVDEDGRTVGYGWMDSTWNGAEILLAVEQGRRGTGVGTFILDRLEEEAQSRGLNYIFNVVQPTHPEREKVTSWLEARGFQGGEDGDLRRRVRLRVQMAGGEAN